MVEKKEEEKQSFLLFEQMQHMIFGVFSLYFSTLELKNLFYERLSFKTQLKNEFLWPHNGQTKVLEHVPEKLYREGCTYAHIE